jgi:hypothetical protein
VRARELLSWNCQNAARIACPALVFTFANLFQ